MTEVSEISHNMKTLEVLNAMSSALIAHSETLADLLGGNRADAISGLERSLSDLKAMNASLLALAKATYADISAEKADDI